LPGFVQGVESEDQHTLRDKVYLFGAILAYCFEKQRAMSKEFISLLGLLDFLN
jgi:hypothetical protein